MTHALGFNYFAEMAGIPDLVIDGLRVPFPYDTIYPEQVRYMHGLKRAIDMKGQG